MYKELHRWDECIAVAEAKVPVLSFPQWFRTRFHPHQKPPVVKEAIGTGTGFGLGADIARSQDVGVQGEFRCYSGIGEEWDVAG